MRKIILGILALIFFVNSCKKPKGDKFCTWKGETTGMDILLNCEEGDTCKFDTLQLLLKFNIKHIDDFPPCGTFKDSVIGNIEKIDVYVNYFMDNDTINKNINDKIKLKIKYSFKDSLLGDLNYINDLHPRCADYFYLYLNSHTDTNCLQSLIVNYKESDGTLYKDTTKSIYIIP